MFRKFKYVFLFLLLCFSLTACDEEILSSDQVVKKIKSQYKDRKIEYLAEIGKDDKGQANHWRFRYFGKIELDFEVQAVSHIDPKFGDSYSYESNLDQLLLEYYFSRYPGDKEGLSLSLDRDARIHFSYRDLDDLKNKRDQIRKLEEYMQEEKIIYSMDAAWENPDPKRFRYSSQLCKNNEEDSSSYLIDSIYEDCYKEYKDLAIRHQFWQDLFSKEEVLSYIQDTSKGHFTVYDEKDQAHYWEDLLAYPLTVETFYLILDRMEYPSLKGDQDHFHFRSLDGDLYEFSSFFIKNNEEKDQAYYIKNGEELPYYWLSIEDFSNMTGLHVNNIWTKERRKSPEEFFEAFLLEQEADIKDLNQNSKLGRVFLEGIEKDFKEASFLLEEGPLGYYYELAFDKYYLTGVHIEGDSNYHLFGHELGSDVKKLEKTLEKRGYNFYGYGDPSFHRKEIGQYSRVYEKDNIFIFIEEDGSRLKSFTLVMKNFELFDEE